MRLHFRIFHLVALIGLGFSGCAGDVQQDSDILLARTHERPDWSYSSVERAAPPETVEPAGIVTLSQALELALEHNPALKAFSWDIRAAEADLLQAELRPNPKLGLQAEEVAGGGQRSGFDAAEMSAKLSQQIEMGQKRHRRTSLASIEKELAEWDYRAKRLDVIREVTEAFAAVLGEQEQLALSTELVRIAEQAHSTVAQRVEAGRDSPTEQTKSAVTLAIARIEPVQAERNLEAARQRLAATWGARDAGFDAVAGQFDEIVPVPSSTELGRSISQNPDVARWQAEKQKCRAALELEKARAVSDITLIGGYQRFNETDDSAVVMGLSIPLAVSNRNQGGIRRATYLLAKTQQSANATETEILASLEEAAQRFAGAHAEATALKDGVLPGAQRTFDAVSEGYRDGKFDYLQVLDAQRILFETRGRYIESLTVYHTAKADVERLIGGSIESIRKTHEDNHKESK